MISEDSRFKFLCCPQTFQTQPFGSCGRQGPCLEVLLDPPVQFLEVVGGIALASQETVETTTEGLVSGVRFCWFVHQAERLIPIFFFDVRHHCCVSICVSHNRFMMFGEFGDVYAN